MNLLRFAHSEVLDVLQVRLQLPRLQALHLQTDTTSRNEIGEKCRLGDGAGSPSVGTGSGTRLVAGRATRVTRVDS